MSSMQWIWITVGIIILLIVVGILAALGRRRGRAGQETADRQEAATMRVAARDTELDARESRAAAAGTAAEAEQAQIEAERLRIQAEERNTAASAQTEESARVRRHADAIDPDVDRKHGDDDA
jgi:preprotein translocase subunit SecF